jgi:hypothetical protein
MIQRFLLDRIDAEAARSTVRVQLHFACIDASHETQTTLSFMHLASARAYIALDATIVESMKVACGMAHCVTEEIDVEFAAHREYGARISRQPSQQTGTAAHS